MKSLCIAIEAAWTAASLDSTISGGLHAEGRVKDGTSPPYCTYLIRGGATNPTLGGKFPYDCICEFMVITEGVGQNATLDMIEAVKTAYDAAGILANCNMRDSMRMSEPMMMPSDPTMAGVSSGRICMATVSYRFSAE